MQVLLMHGLTAGSKNKQVHPLLEGATIDSNTILKKYGAFGTMRSLMRSRDP